MYYRAFWQRSCRAAAAGAVLKPSGGNCAVLPYIFFGGEEEDGHLRSLPHLLAKAEAGAIGQGDIRRRQVVWPGGPQGVSLGQGAAAVSA